MNDVEITIDGRSIVARAGTTILEAARNAGIYIPTLCSHPALGCACESVPSEFIFQGKDRLDNAIAGGKYDGCGLCVVEVEGSGVALSCVTPVSPGARIRTGAEHLNALRRQRVAELLADHPHACLVCPEREGCSQSNCSFNLPEAERCCSKFHDCELRRVAEYIGIPESTVRYLPSSRPVVGDEPLFRRDYNLCIGCLRCVGACRGRRGLEALGFVFDTDGKVLAGARAPSLRESGCKFCGACVEVCPTGALTDKTAGRRKSRLRLSIPPPSLPPGKWLRLEESQARVVPETEGVLTIADGQENTLLIKGAMDLRKELLGQLGNSQGGCYFSYEEEPMYTRRESELLQAYLKKHGKMPPQNIDLDDLYS